MKIGERVRIPVSILEFDVGGHTLWIHDQSGACTVLRLKTTHPGGIGTTDACQNPAPHCDVLTSQPIYFCLPQD